MFKCSMLFLLLLASTTARAESVDQKAEAFFGWLSKNEKLFIDCKIQKTDDIIELCDRTKISYSEIKGLFAKPMKDIITDLKKKNIQVDIICQPGQTSIELKEVACLTESSDQTFKKATSLHGLYLPDTNKILIRSSATRSILIHEYLHSLQSANTEKIDGHIYKAEKNALRRAIDKELDRLMAEITAHDKTKLDTKSKERINQFVKTNNFMFAFGKWQDLIDERSLFLLFEKFEKDFQIPPADMALVKKNLKFICDRKDISGKLPECSL